MLHRKLSLLAVIFAVIPPSLAAQGAFGSSLAVSGREVYVGQPGNSYGPGVVYVFRADAQGASPTARKALGFEELLHGDAAATTARTRRYAKRQLTWMRKLPGVRIIDVTGREPSDVAAELHGMIRGA